LILHESLNKIVFAAGNSYQTDMTCNDRDCPYDPKEFTRTGNDFNGRHCYSVVAAPVRAKQLCGSGDNRATVESFETNKKKEWPA